MARKTTMIESGEERIEVLNPADTVPEGQLPTGDSEVVADATAKNPPLPQDVEVPTPKRYRVTKGGMFMAHGGYRAKLHEGKEIDTLNYDIKKLQQQGIKVELIADEG